MGGLRGRGESLSEAGRGKASQKQRGQRVICAQSFFDAPTQVGTTPAGATLGDEPTASAKSEI